MSTKSILNFIPIDARIGTGGQPTREQLEAAREEGYQAVINLAPNDTESHALPDEEAVLKALGLEYRHIPVAWTAPRKEHFVAFIAAMAELEQKKLLIHCAANFRVTAFYSLYAMRNAGWSVEQADALIAKIWESRPDFRMDATWRAFIGDIREQIATSQI